MNKVEKNFSGSVPNGEYHSINSPEQAIAIKHTKRIAQKLIQQHPETIIRLYEQGLSYMEIAQKIIPNITEQYPKIAPKAVGYAVREINDSQKQQEITKQHRANTLDKVIGNRLTPENKKIWRLAQATRTAIHGAPTEEMIRGRGQIPWSLEEKEVLQQLLQDSQYRVSSNAPNYSSIAKKLNQLFHNNEPIRTKKSLGNYVRDLRRKAKK